MRRMSSAGLWAEGKAGRSALAGEQGPRAMPGVYQGAGPPCRSPRTQQGSCSPDSRPSELLPQRDASVGVGRAQPCSLRPECWLRH